METQNNKNCEFKDNVIDYCEGLLGGEDAERVEKHIESCAECADTVREHKEFCEALDACNSDVPAELHESIMRAVRREALRVKLMRAMKRYAAPVAAALLLIVAVPVIFSGRGGDVNAPELYSLNGDTAELDYAVDGGKGRAGEPTDSVKSEEDHEIAPAEEGVADIVVEPSVEAQDSTLEAYQYVVENGEVVTCYNCPVFSVDADTAKALAKEFPSLVVLSEDGGFVFKTDKSLLKALSKAGYTAANVDRADYIRVNVK